MRNKMMYLVCTCVFGLLAVAGARADTIGPNNCSSCFGSAYTLTYSTVNSNTFDVFLNVDATGSTSGDFLNAVAVKVSSQDPSTVTWLAGPSGFSSVEFGGTNASASGCAASTTDGFFCDPYSGSGYGVPVGASGDIYNFEWQVMLASASDLFTGVDAASVKAVYLDSNGKFAAQTSEPITLQPGTPVIPEPPSLVLLGTGLLILAGAFKAKLLVG